MRVFDRLVRRLSPAAASALALALGHSLAPCGAVAAQLRQAAVVPAEASLLKRLPASRDELVFRGENASRDWLVYLSPAEAARAASFQLAMLERGRCPARPILAQIEHQRASVVDAADSIA